MQNNRRKITKSIIESSKSNDKDYIIWDSAIIGFGIKITSRGDKSFLLYYRAVTRRQRKPVIGKYGQLTVEKARDIAKQWLGRIAVGDDISAERMKSKNGQVGVLNF